MNMSAKYQQTSSVIPEFMAKNAHAGTLTTAVGKFETSVRTNKVPDGPGTPV